MNINKNYQLNHISDVIDNFFSPFYGREFDQNIGDNSFLDHLSGHKVQVSYKNSDLQLDFFVPGWPKNELQLEYSENFLTLTGQPKKKASDEEPEEKVLNIRLEVAKKWDLASAKTKLLNGILTIIIPEKLLTPKKSLKIS